MSGSSHHQISNSSLGGADKPLGLVTQRVGTIVVGISAIAAGLFALYFVTNFFENLMHNSADFFAGRSTIGAFRTGILTGTLHTLAGPDHFAGIAPMVVGQQASTIGAFGLGALWGSGHALGQLILGLGCLALQRCFLQVGPQISGAFNFDQVSGVLVGLAMVTIGVLGFKEADQFEKEELEEESAPHGRFGWRSLGTGIVHGLSPDSLVFLAPALAMPRLAAICHVSGVFAGTLLSMGFFTALLKIVCRRMPKLSKFARGVSIVALLVGGSILASALGFSMTLPSWLPGLA
jgi:hypothetical protein